MALYRFAFEGDHLGSMTDPIRCEDDASARAQAVRAAGEALWNLQGRFWGAPQVRVTVTDDQGTTICALTITGEAGVAHSNLV